MEIKSNGKQVDDINPIEIIAEGFFLAIGGFFLIISFIVMIFSIKGLMMLIGSLLLILIGTAIHYFNFYMEHK